MEQTLEIMDKDFKGVCFVNLVDFDALWGHRRNPVGYAQELEKFDVNLGKVIDKLGQNDFGLFDEKIFSEMILSISLLTIANNDLK